MFKKEIIEIIRHFISDLKQRDIPIERAFLYGSYAKDLAKEESDIDVLLLSQLFDSDFDHVAGKIWVIAKKNHEMIEPYMVGSHRFKTDDVSPLLEIVRQEVIEI